MSSDLVAELSQRALQLPPEERARLAEELWASIHVHDEGQEDPAWDAEIRRRVEEVDRGIGTLVPAEEAFARARSALR